MEYKFSIEHVPEEKGGYNLSAYTEGTLKVVLDGVTFLNSTGILLVEFAIVLSKWIRALGHSNGMTELYYSSMDFEEEPIFALRVGKEKNYYLPEAVWSEGEALKILPEEAISAANRYLSELGTILANNHGVDLSEVVEDAIRS